MKTKILILLLLSIPTTQAASFITSTTVTAKGRMTTQEKLITCSTLNRFVNTFHSRMNETLKAKLLGADLKRTKILLNRKLDAPNITWADQATIKSTLTFLEYSSIPAIVVASYETKSSLNCPR